MKDIQHRPEKYILKHDLEQTLGELLMQAHQLRDSGAEFEALRVEGIIYKIAEKFDMKQFL